MFTALSRSYQIFRQSLTILSKDKELLVFPLLSGIVTIVAFVAVVAGGVSSGFFARMAENDRSFEANALGYFTMFLWYFVSWFIVLFFNVAIVHCARMRLEGGDPTIGDGFRASLEHVNRILLWAFISASVGIILRIIADRAKLIGKIIVSIMGAAWSIATYFIVPVMIFERRTLRESISQSTSLISRTWGESLIAAAGIGAFTFLLAIAGLALPILGLLIDPRAALIGLLLAVVWWIALAVISSALSSIFRTALYMYASTGASPSGYSPDFVEGAFAAKKGAMARPAIRFS